MFRVFAREHRTLMDGAHDSKNKQNGKSKVDLAEAQKACARKTN